MKVCGLWAAAENLYHQRVKTQGSGANPAKPPVSSHPPDWDETIAASAPTVVFPKTTGPTGLPTSSNLQSQPQTPAPSAPVSPPVVSTPASSAPVPQTPSKPTPPPPAKSAPLPAAQRAPAPAAAGVQPVAKKKSKLPLILGILAILLVLGAGAVVAAF